MSENDYRPGCECGQVRPSARAPSGMLIVDDPYDARESPDPEAVHRWFTEALSGIDELGVGARAIVRDDDILEHSLLASTLASIDRALAEEPPGSVRAIACRALTGLSLDEFQRASAQLRAEAMVTLSTTGTVSGTLAPGPVGRKVIRCENAWPGEGFTAGGSFEVTSGVDLDALATSNVGKIGTLGAPPAPVFGVLATLPTWVLHPETAPYLMNLRNLSASDEARLDAIQWLRLNGYYSIASVKDECDRVHDEISAARLGHAGARPLGKAPQCGHQAITHGCSTCAILREHLARVGVDRAARILMAEAGTLGPADADDLRRQFGLPTPVVHIENHYGADPVAIADGFASDAGQKSALNVIRGNPVRRRADEISASRATGYADRPYAERAAMLQYDEVNRIADGYASTVEIAGLQSPPLRPDGFLQSQVDAAKAVLLAPVVPKGKKP